MHKKVLITGGAGFIGRNLSKYLKFYGPYHTTVIDNFSTGRPNPCCDVLLNFTIGTATKSDIFRAVEHSDYVIHLAATVGVKNVMKNLGETVRNNIETTEVVLEAVRQYHKRAIIASTSEVYGKNTAELSEDSSDCKYGPTIKTRWSYAVSKLVDEYLTLDLWNKYQTPVTVVRLFNVSGPEQLSSYGMVIPTFIEQAKKNAPITIIGDGKQKRSFTHIWDVCYIIGQLLKNEQSYGEILNLGNPAEVSIEDLAKYIVKKTKSSSTLSYQTEKYGPGFEDMERRFPNVEKLTSLVPMKAWKTYKEIVDDSI